MKNVQIDYELFLDIVDYFFTDKDEFLEERIVRQLSTKIDKIVAHKLFSEYKTAPKNSEEREQLRQKYLDEVGMLRSFRSDSEIQPLRDEI